MQLKGKITQLEITRHSTERTFKVEVYGPMSVENEKIFLNGFTNGDTPATVHVEPTPFGTKCQITFGE
jgi:hypothetical protein